MELEERRALLKNRALQIALHLPDGWMPSPAEDSMDEDRAIFAHPSGMRFNLTLPHPHTHLHVRVWDWPKMREYKSDYKGELTETEYRPSSLSPRRETPQANIALSKSDQRVADEITSRVLNPYIEVWNLCKINADKWTANAIKAKQDWEAVCKVAGIDSKRSSMHATIGCMWVNFERRNSTVHISMDIPPEQAIELIDLMRHVNPVPE